MRNTSNIYNILLNSAARLPEKTAIVEPERQWTYTELLQAVNRAADAFWNLGIRKGDKVALALRNSAEFIITGMAAAKMGAAMVPVNFMVSKPEELAFILSDSQCKGVITQREFLRNYTKTLQTLGTKPFLLSIDGSANGEAEDFWELVNRAGHTPQAHQQQTSPDDISCLLYTSGTTGNPKGVILSHYNMISNAISAQAIFSVTDDDVFLCLLPMFHTFSWLGTTLLPLMMGCKTVVISHLTPPKPWLRLMGREGVTVMTGVPQLFAVLAKEASGLKRLYLQYWSFRRARILVSGAAPLPRETGERFRQAIGVPLLEGYGLTETSPVISVNTPEENRPGSVGRPMPGIRVAVIGEAGNHLPAGQEGEICVKGPNVTAGYHNNPQASRDLFTADGWMRTGDIGLVDEDGFVFIRDRIKDMIIIKGLKVFSAQVEAVLQNHPALAEVAVIGIPDESGDETIKAFCVLKEGAECEKAELKNFIRENLDPYKRPKEIEFMAELPKNALNKILKRKLRETEIARLKNKKTACRPVPGELVTGTAAVLGRPLR
ncbi:MAG: long-chain-fatty-acid--CoA ligase [Elusimicrobiaceae bacterium]|nr:long-chain-fatty-acid--CoA ligase [Elusimicrobiaceae bacterium]